MTRSEGGIGEAFARVAETFGRLVAQHLTLMRTELESEARRVGERAKTTSIAVGRALPFIVAGVVLASFAAAEALSFALEGVLGRLAHPAALALVGTVETALAVRWLLRTLPAAQLPRVGEEPPVEKHPVAPAADDGQRAPDGAGSGAPQSTARNPREMTYGAVGRA